MKKINLNKILNNKILFLLPNLLVLGYFSYFFVSNYSLYLSGGYEILYTHVIVLFFIYLLIITLIHFLLKKIFNKYNVFFIKILLILITFNINNIFLIILLLLLLILIFIKNNNVKTLGVFLISYIILVLFIFNFLPSTFDIILFSLNTKSYDKYKNIVVDKDLEKPNIYWIHADGMLSLSTAEKYINVDTKEIKKYFKNNDFYTNDNANLVAAHHTMQALVALYNPYYYDEFFKDYLLSLEETFYDNKKKVSYYVNYNDLLDRRLNNEFFNSLNKAGYDIATITDFNQYSSFYADYIYNLNNIDVTLDEKADLWYFTNKNNSYNTIKSAIKFEYYKTLLSQISFYSTFSQKTFLNYDILNYDDFNYLDYDIINNSEYLKSKAILYSLNDLNKKNINNKFVFIDYTINHAPWIYDKDGKISKGDNYSFQKAGDTYQHSLDVLIEIVAYIKDNDPNGIIVVQGDHGMHTIFLSKEKFSESDARLLRNSTINAVYIPKKYKNGEEDVLGNPLNISRYLINNFVGDNYKYIK